MLNKICTWLQKVRLHRSFDAAFRLHYLRSDIFLPCPKQEPVSPPDAVSEHPIKFTVAPLLATCNTNDNF